MESRLEALLALFSTLEVSPNIETIQDRKLLQKAVYLAQEAGANLGYSYGWYVKGPYSPQLAADYYDAVGETKAAGHFATPQLSQPLSAKARRIVPLFNVPKDVELNQSDWMELLASIHFLLKYSGSDLKGARQLIRDRKPELQSHFMTALDALRRYSLA